MTALHYLVKFRHAYEFMLYNKLITSEVLLCQAQYLLLLFIIVWYLHVSEIPHMPHKSHNWYSRGLTYEASTQAIK